MADNIVRLKVDSTEYDSKVKRAADGILALERSIRNAGESFIQTWKDEQDFAKGLGDMETKSKTVSGRISEIKSALTEMSVVYKRMSDEEKASPFGQNLGLSLDKLKSRLKEEETTLADVRRELGDTGREAGGISGVLDTLAGKFGLNVSQLTKFGAATTAAAAAVKVAKDAFFQSESNIDEWGRTVEGAKGAYDVFLQTINGGNWTNFLQNLTAAIQGARDLYDSLDRLGSIKSNNQAAIALAQQQVQQLRLMKQQGKDVDAQLKEAVKNLATLQSQSVVAGRIAGRDMVANTIRNRVNASNTTGVNVSDAAVRGAASRVIRGGQAAVDSYTQQYEQLRRKGLETFQRYNERTNTYYNEEVFTLAKLSESEQKRYLIAEAVKERETEIQKGIGIYAQAVQEGASSAREQFKGNRYAMQGTGGGAGGGGGVKVQSISTKYMPGIGFNTTESRDELRGRLSAAQQGLSGATNTIDDGMYRQQIEDIQKQIAAQPLALSLGISTEAVVSLQEQINHLTDGLNIEPIEVNFEATGTEQLVKDVELLKTTTQGAGSAMTTLGGALAGLKDPGAKVAGIVMQAIGNVALSFSQAMATPKDPWSWIAFAVTGAATMISTIAAIHSATGYAEGGIVKGNSYSGDNVGALVDGSQFVGLNAGEIVLSKSQQSNLANALQTSPIEASERQSYVRGQDIYLGLQNYLKATGRGQLVLSRA